MRLRATALCAALMLVVAGCSASPESVSQVQPGSVEETAAALAQGLAIGDLTNVALVEGSGSEAMAQLEAVTAGMDGLRPRVRVIDVALGQDRNAAQAELEQVWDVDSSDRDWTYTVVADLVLVDDQWQVTWSPSLVAPGVTAGETLTMRRTLPPRGKILGAGGVPIVEDRPVWRLGLDKTQVTADAQPASAGEIATMLEIDAASFVERVATAGEKAFVEALVVRTENPGIDLDTFLAIPGARVLDSTLPLAPTRDFARAVLGTAGPATAELIDASDGMLQPGDIAGLSGLQQRYDAQLRGSPGIQVEAQNPDGDDEVLFEVEAVSGQDLATTLDPYMQQGAEEVLIDVDVPASIVAVRPSTGDILSVANSPGSNNYPTATTGQYAPGSVFKVVTSLALLRAGMQPGTTVACPPTTTVDGRVFHNYPDYPSSATGSIDLRTAIAYSCNTALIDVRDQAPPEALVDAATALGLGSQTDLGFPAFLGSVPVDSTGTDHAASMIGQARIQASPLAMAGVTASIAAGRTVTPHLLSSGPEAVAPAVPLTADEAAALRDLMRAVVIDGSGRFLSDVPGEPVLAKTGTAEYGTGDPLPTHAWMIAIHGDLAVAVFVETGDHGSTTAGPLLKQFLTDIA